MTEITTIDKVKNYEGNNGFLLSMKYVLAKYKNLTPKQLAASENILYSEFNAVDMEKLPENIKSIVDYKGKNSFVKKMQEKFMTYRSLSDHQIESSNERIQKELDKNL